MFYTYYQNNSGGVFRPPAEFVIIEGDSLDEANERAVKEVGLYFDGVANGVDCECCGDRWSPYAMPTDQPSIYGQPPEEYNPRLDFAALDGIPRYVVVRKG